MTFYINNDKIIIIKKGKENIEVMNKENKKIKMLRKIERILEKKIKIINNNKDFNTNIEEVLQNLSYIRTKVIYIRLCQLRAKGVEI